MQELDVLAFTSTLVLGCFCKEDAKNMKSSVAYNQEARYTEQTVPLVFFLRGCVLVVVLVLVGGSHRNAGGRCKYKLLMSHIKRVKEAPCRVFLPLVHIRDKKPSESFRAKRLRMAPSSGSRIVAANPHGLFQPPSLHGPNETDDWRTPPSGWRFLLVRSEYVWQRNLKQLVFKGRKKKNINQKGGGGAVWPALWPVSGGFQRLSIKTNDVWASLSRAWGRTLLVHEAPNGQTLLGWLEHNSRSGSRNSDIFSILFFF